MIKTSGILNLLVIFLATALRPMRISKHHYLIGFITFVCLPAAVQADRLHKKDIFSISVPDGWVEIPRNEIDAAEKEVAKLAPNVPAQHYDYGFQLSNAKNWFEYPYLLVQIKNTGRMPESQLEKLEGYSVQADLDKRRNDLSRIASDIHAGKMYYDKAAKIIWLRTESNITGVGAISTLSGIIPTEKGFIQVSGYSLKRDYDTYRPMFRSSSMSVTPRSDLIYKPRWSDSLPPAVSGIDWDKVAGNAIVGAIVGGLIALFVGFGRKKKE